MKVKKIMRLNSFIVFFSLLLPVLNIQAQENDKCYCEVNPETSMTGSLLLTDIADYKDLLENTPFRMANPVLWDKLLYKNHSRNATPANDKWNAQLSLLCNDPIVLEVSKTPGLQLNLNPCSSYNFYHQTDIDVNVNHRILKHDRKFNVNDYDFKAESSYDLLLKITGLSNSELLSEGIFKYMNDSVSELISIINEEYFPIEMELTGIAFNDNYMLSSFIDEEYIRLIKEGAKKEKWNLTEHIVWNEFIVNPAVAKGENPEKIYNDRIVNLFNRVLGISDITELYELLYPEVSANIPISYCSLIFTPERIHDVDDVDESVPLIFETNNVNFTTESGLQVRPESNICHTPLIIEPLGMIAAFDTFALDVSLKHNYFQSFHYFTFYEELDSLFYELNNPLSISSGYESLTGIVVPNMELEWPLVDEEVIARGTSFIISDRILGGEIEIEILNKNGNSIEVATTNGSTWINTKQIMKYFKQSGIRDFKIVFENWDEEEQRDSLLSILFYAED